MGLESFTIEAWVKLSHLSLTASSDERQYLCQKKPVSASDNLFDHAVLVQRGDNSPGVNFGKQSGFSGRELQIVFGTGAGTWGVTSNLQVNTADWHFVSVAVDVPDRTVRFQVGDQSEILGHANQARVANAGPLVVGAHRSQGGADNFRLHGSIDELRISRGVLPPGRMLSWRPTPDSSDANGDGIPDECEGPAPCAGDLNCDGRVDFLDIDLFVEAFGHAGGVGWPYAECPWRQGDCDGDGDVDFMDVDVFVARLGSVCP
jgi:hypothetical protein